MSRRKRAEQTRALVAHVLTAPILIEGDAEELLCVLRAGARTAKIAVTDHASAAQPALVVLLAVEKDARRSSLVKAASMLRALDDLVVQSARSRLAPPKLQRLVASEVLFQVALALSGIVPDLRERTLRQRLGLATLDAAGLRILRFG
jgi:hypothetical protein